MTSLIQSVFALILGLALSFFGLVHSVTKYPGASTFAQLVSYLPTIGSVLFFGVGVIAAVGGVTLLIVSSRRLKQRWRYLKQVSGHRRSYDHLDHDDERDWAAYRH